MRAAPIFAKQRSLLDSLELPTSGATRGVTLSRRASDGLAVIGATVAHYETKLSGSQTIKDVMKIIASEIESDGIYISNRAEPHAPRSAVTSFRWPQSADTQTLVKDLSTATSSSVMRAAICLRS